MAAQKTNKKPTPASRRPKPRAKPIKKPVPGGPVPMPYPNLRKRQR